MGVCSDDVSGVLGRSNGGVNRDSCFMKQFKASESAVHQCVFNGCFSTVPGVHFDFRALRLPGQAGLVLNAVLPRF